MAVGNESDLQVKISVNTEEVRVGFEKIVSMTDGLVRDVESRLSKLDFSRVFDTSKITSSLSSAVSEVTKGIKPIEIRTKVKVPKVPTGKVVSEGGMASVDIVRDRVRGKSVAAEESQVMAKKETHTQIISRYVHALREQATALERVRDLQRDISKSENNPALHASLQTARNLWQSRLGIFNESVGKIGGKYGRNKWFSDSPSIREAQSTIGILSAEREITREKQRQRDIAEDKAKTEREALVAIAAANQLYRIASRVLSKVVSAFREWIGISNEIYQSQLKLGAALRVGVELSNAQVRATYAMVESLSMATGLSLEMNYTAAQMMASYVKTSDELETMMKSLDDLVVKMYGFNANSEQAKMLAKQLGRALSGNVDILQRQGIVLTENEKAILKSSTVERAEKIRVLTAAIARLTGDMSQESRTWAGVLGRIRVYGGIIKNNFGQALQNALKPMLDIILGIAQGLATISEWTVAISRFAFGNNVKGAEEFSNTIAGLNDELDNLQSRLLGFDKFNVLSGSNTDYSALLGGAGEKSGEGEKGASDGLGDVGEFFAEITGASELLKVALTGISVALGTIVTLTGVLMAAGLIAKLKTLVASLNLANAGISLTKANLITLTAGITLLITGVTTLISTFDDLNNWDELTGWQKATTIFKLLIGSVMTVVGAILALTATTRIFGKTALAEFFKVGAGAKALTVTMKVLNSEFAMIAAVTAIVASLAYFVTNLNNMSTAAKVLIPIMSALVGVITAFAIANAAAKAGIAAGPVALTTAGLLAAAITMAVGTALATSNKARSIGVAANGGMPDRGQLFIANENGPELVGNIGGNVSVANNAMIVSAIEEAAYRGFSRAQDEGGANGISITLQGDGVRNDALVRALMPALRTEVKRQGGLKKAFGE